MTADRRGFLKVGASVMIATFAGSACSDQDSRALDHPQLLEMLGPDRLRGLGARYRALFPDENSARALNTAISASRSALHLPGLHKSIDNVVRDDFAAGRTVLVDGWVLSLTEARQCALFSLAFG